MIYIYQLNNPGMWWPSVSVFAFGISHFIVELIIEGAARKYSSKKIEVKEQEQVKGSKVKEEHFISHFEFSCACDCRKFKLQSFKRTNNFPNH